MILKDLMKTTMDMSKLKKSLALIRFIRDGRKNSIELPCYFSSV